MKNYKLCMVVILFLTGGLFSACEKKVTKEEGMYYTCPMHPDVKKDQPGQCSICGMDLVKKKINN